MADEPSWRRDEQSDDEEIDETAYKTQRDAVLFAIEVNSSMLGSSSSASKDCALAASLKAAYSLMQQRIISNPKDMMGIILYGTDKSRFLDDTDREGKSHGITFPHCYLLTDLDIPSAQDVKAIKSLLEQEDKFNELMVPSKEPVTMSNLLFCVNQIFTMRAPNFQSRRLFLVTDNDEPHGANKSMASAAVVRAKDLYDLGVTIDLFPISHADRGFDKTKFYNDIVYDNLPMDPEATMPLSLNNKLIQSTGDGIALLNSLISATHSRAVAKSALFAALPLEFSPDFSISVKGYIYFKRQEPKRSTYVWTGGEKIMLAKVETSKTLGDSSDAIDPRNIRKAYKFGGETITFSTEEAEELRKFGEPVIRILGFKPATDIPIWASVKPAVLIYPTEDSIIGSTRVFSALHQKLLKDNKVALAWYKARKNATPSIVAIFPSSERNDEATREQVFPPGLWLITLPFADDIRRNPDSEIVPAPDTLIDKMRDIIQQLQLPKARYMPEKYPNPSLQWHYKILQALALEEDLPEKPIDKTLPSYKAVEKRAGDLIRQWGEELTSASETIGATVKSESKLPKRPASTQNGDKNTAKKVKVEDEEGVSFDTVKTHYDKGTLNKLTVKDLRHFLTTDVSGPGRKADIPNAAKKADLIVKVEGYFS